MGHIVYCGGEMKITIILQVVRITEDSGYVVQTITVHGNKILYTRDTFRSHKCVCKVVEVDEV